MLEHYQIMAEGLCMLFERLYCDDTTWVDLYHPAPTSGLSGPFGPPPNWTPTILYTCGGTCSTNSFRSPTWEAPGYMYTATGLLTTSDIV